MARSFGVSFVVAVVLVALFAQAAQGSVVDEVHPGNGRRLRLYNIFTTRGWSTKAAFGVGFKYKAYGGKVTLGPFSFKKNPAIDPTQLTFLQELRALFG